MSKRSKILALVALAVVCAWPIYLYASTVLTGAAASTVVGTYTAPAAGDLVTGNSVQVPIQGLANDIATLRKQRLALVGGAINREGDSNIVTGELDLGVLPPFAVTGSASNGGLIKLTTSNGAGLIGIGDLVQVSAVGGTTEANDFWIVSSASGTDITLYNSVFTNAWTSGGTITRRSQIAYASVFRLATRKLRTTWNDGPLPIPTPTRGWSLASGDGPWVNTAGTPTVTQQSIYWSIGSDAAPIGAYLSSVNVYYQPAGAHVANPGTFPSVTVWKHCTTVAVGTTTPITGFADTALNVVVDTAANPAAYQVFRTIVVPISSEPVDHYHCRYTVQVFTETGVNALQGMSVHGADITFNTRNAQQF